MASWMLQSSEVANPAMLSQLPCAPAAVAAAAAAVVSAALVGRECVHPQGHLCSIVGRPARPEPALLSLRQPRAGFWLLLYAQPL